MSTSWRQPARIRPIAIGIVVRNRQLLVEAVQDAAGQIEGWRPLGGGIEPGERAAAALRREFLEELGLAIAEPRLLAVIENLFEYQGLPGHEIVFAFETAFEDSTAYEQDVLDIRDDGGVGCQGRWIDIDRFRRGEERLFPPELLAHL